MVREIKFRGKRLDNGEWAIGYLTEMWGALHIVNRDGGNMAYPVDPATVGQFTGEFDDLGVEIYEDDLVEYPECVDLEEYEWGAPARPRPIIARTKHQVKFIEGCFWLIPATDGGDEPIPLYELDGSQEPRVVGSIHDKPESLKIR